MILFDIANISHIFQTTKRIDSIIYYIMLNDSHPAFYLKKLRYLCENQRRLIKLTGKSSQAD